MFSVVYLFECVFVYLFVQVCVRGVLGAVWGACMKSDNNNLDHQLEASGRHAGHMADKPNTGQPLQTNCHGSIHFLANALQNVIFVHVKSSKL